MTAQDRLQELQTNHEIVAYRLAAAEKDLADVEKNGLGDAAVAAAHSLVAAARAEIAPIEQAQLELALAIAAELPQAEEKRLAEEVEPDPTPDVV